MWLETEMGACRGRSFLTSSLLSVDITSKNLVSVRNFFNISRGDVKMDTNSPFPVRNNEAREKIRKRSSQRNGAVSTNPSEIFLKSPPARLSNHLLSRAKPNGAEPSLRIEPFDFAEFPSSPKLLRYLILFKKRR